MVFPKCPTNIFVIIVIVFEINYSNKKMYVGKQFLLLLSIYYINNL
jgi:hypothetical protein